MHKVAPAISEAVDIPLLNIIDATAQAIRQQGLHTIGLLGTRFTMSDGFYHQQISPSGLSLLTPSEAEQNEIHRIIFDELCLGKIRSEDRTYFQNVICRLQTESAEGIILGCTEIGLLLSSEGSLLPLFDTTYIHISQAVDFCLHGSRG